MASNKNMAQNLSVEQIRDFKDAFALFDKNGNGNIDGKELKKLMRTFGQNPSEQEIKDMMKTLDVNRSGTVDFAEFLKLMSGKVSKNQKEEELMASFRLFDKVSELLGDLDINL